MGSSLQTEAAGSQIIYHAIALAAVGKTFTQAKAKTLELFTDYQSETYLFERRQVAYMLVERDKDRRFFVPRASNEEGIAYLRAIESLTSDQFGGARKNLIEAGYHLARKEYSKSIRESIHSIESMIRVLTGNKNIKFSDGMRELSKKFSLHPAFGEGLIKFYGFSSDEDGVRHSSIQGTESIDEETAFYFLGSCASFITLLIHKARKHKLKEEQGNA